MHKRGRTVVPWDDVVWKAIGYCEGIWIREEGGVDELMGVLVIGCDRAVVGNIRWVGDSVVKVPALCRDVVDIGEMR